MNLQEQYKKLFKSKVSSNDKTLLKEDNSSDRFDDDEGQPSVFLVDEKVTDSLYDIHEIIKFIDNDLNDNDLGGDIAKPVLEKIATQLNDLHDELLEITDEGDRLITPYR